MIFGWDISTSIIGSAIFSAGGSYIASDHLDLRKMDPDMIDKADTAASWVTSIAKKHGMVDPYDHTHYIEDKLGGFSGGRTMQQTLLKLAAFNATISYVIWRSFHDLGMGGTIEHIHPSTAKAIMKREGLIIPKGGDKKAITLEYVSTKELNFVVDRNRNDKPQPWCYDRADAYVMARAGWLRAYLSHDATGKKASTASIGVSETRDDSEE